MSRVSTWGAIALAFASYVHAEDFPVRPIRLIVPFSAGGPADGIARLAAAQMSAGWNQIGRAHV